MADDDTPPGKGLLKNPFKGMPKPAIYATIAGTLGIGGYFVYKHHKSTGSWNPWSSATGVTATNSSTAIDPVTGLPTSQDDVVDPITGLTYLAEATQYGSVATAEASVSAYGQSTASGSGIPVNPASPAASGSPNTVVGTSVYTSNAAWSQAVQAGLQDISGSTTYDGTDIGTALGAYLQQEPLTAAQGQLINTAIAEYGPAPVGNLQIILQPASSASTTTTTAGSSTPSISGGHVVSSSPTGGVVGWTWVNATKATVKITGPGKINGQTGTVTKPEATYEGLESGHDYTVTVTPYNSAGVAGKSGTINFTTPPASAAAKK